MEVFVAKQPIFNNKEEVYAYELLYRDSYENSFPNINGDQATADVIINSFLNIGIEELSNGKPCFINFTENLLQLRLPTYFGPREIVVEILESVNPTEEMIEICKELKSLGYQIALDDVVVQNDDTYFNPLFHYADFIKVDFLSTSKEIREKIESLSKELHIKMIAEKVETKEAFEEAKQSGYEYFQGYLFAKPSIVSTYDIPSYFFSNYECFQDTLMNETSIDVITEIIERDLFLSYKLLKLINSPVNREKQQIHSVKQAVILLGLIEIKKWLYILSIREKVIEKTENSKEVLHLSLTRAKMCESIEMLRNNRTSSSTTFTLGMFSLLDQIMGIPMEQVIQDLPLHNDIKNALAGVQNSLKDVLDLVSAVEKAQWGIISEKCHDFSIDEKDLFKIYAESLNWSNKLLSNVQVDAI